MAKNLKNFVQSKINNAVNNATSRVAQATGRSSSPASGALSKVNTQLGNVSANATSAIQNRISSSVANTIRSQVQNATRNSVANSIANSTNKNFQDYFNSTDRFNGLKDLDTLKKQAKLKSETNSATSLVNNASNSDAKNRLAALLRNSIQYKANGKGLVNSTHTQGYSDDGFDRGPITLKNLGDTLKGTLLDAFDGSDLDRWYTGKSVATQKRIDDEARMKYIDSIRNPVGKQKSINDFVNGIDDKIVKGASGINNAMMGGVKEASDVYNVLKDYLGSGVVKGASALDKAMTGGAKEASDVYNVLKDYLGSGVTKGASALDKGITKATDGAKLIGSGIASLPSEWKEMFQADSTRKDNIKEAKDMKKENEDRRKAQAALYGHNPAEPNLFVNPWGWNPYATTINNNNKASADGNGNGNEDGGSDNSENPIAAAREALDNAIRNAYGGGGYGGGSGGGSGSADGDAYHITPHPDIPTVLDYAGNALTGRFPDNMPWDYNWYMNEYDKAYDAGKLDFKEYLDYMMNRSQDNDAASLQNILDMLNANKATGLTSGASTGAQLASNMQAVKSAVDSNNSKDRETLDNAMSLLYNLAAKKVDQPASALAAINAFYNPLAAAMGNIVGYYGYNGYNNITELVNSR